MKTAAIFIISIVISLSAFCKDSIGYWVVCNGTETTVYKCKTIEKATEILKTYFPDNCISLEKELKHSNYFRIETEIKCYYIEKKRINKRGKYRKL